MRGLFSRFISTTIGTALFAALASPAWSAIIIYDVNLNFDPTTIDGGPGVGTITGTVTIDTSIPIRDNRLSTQTGYQPTDVTAVDLVEKTNNNTDAIGGAFGSPTYDTFTFDQTDPFTIVFIGTPTVFQTSTANLDQKNYEFGGLPFITLFFQTNCCNFDGLPIGPSITFDFPFPQGGTVAAGNFDSVTSETRFLYGTVTPETASAAPEPATWALMAIGFAGLGFAGFRRASHRVSPAPIVR